MHDREVEIQEEPREDPGAEEMLEALHRAQKQAREEQEAQERLELLHKAQRQAKDEQEMDKDFYWAEEKKATNIAELPKSSASGYDSAEMELVLQSEGAERDRMDKLKIKDKEEKTKKRQAQEKGSIDLKDWKK